MKVTPKLIQKYVTNKCTEEEKEAVEKWLNNTSQEEKTIQLPTSQYQEKKLWDGIESEITYSNKKKKRSTNFLWLVACSIAICFGLGISLLFPQSPTDTYQTNVSEIRTITLYDGTKVTLNSNSTLKVAPFTKGERKVWLEGEAFFDVAKDSLHPFIVLTESSRTKVLGTEFNLSEHQQDQTEITLKEGKISFEAIGGNDKQKIIILLPNDQVIINNGRCEKRTVNANNYVLWMQKKLYFNHEKLESIVQTIENQYDIKIVISDASIAQKSFHGVVNSENLDTILDELSFVLDFNYKTKNKKIIIY